jgi:two-component system chemotaxis sensor kinase CheA
VAASKLDLLLARSGELLVAERRLARNEESLAVVGESLGRLQRDWKLAIQDQGELTSRLRHARADLERLGATLRDDRRAIGRAVASMDEEVRRVRLLPFTEACQGLDRAIRDLAKERGKEVEVIVSGAALELDRSILEGLKDPLLALARNAVDHGIEPLAKRRASGKAEKGRVVISAALRGSRLEVSVEDDGAGVDLAAVEKRSLERGLPAARDQLAVLFEPGFSTAARVTDISGRGVGLDIVKTRVTELRGTVELTSRPGQGTRVELTLPATLTTLRALLVSAGGETLAIPGASVERLLRIDPKEIRSIGGREVVASGSGPPIPIFSLARVLSLPEREGRSGKIVAVATGAPMPAAFAVDDLLSEREILVKALGPRLRKAGKVAGATVLETGHVALILNVAEVTRAAFERTGETSLAVDRTKPLSKRRILLADDSATTRSLERAILEAAGYEVVTAVDGEQAFRLLHDRGADLVVSDIDMPRMDGLTLCKAVRGSKRFRDLPLVLVSSLESERDRARGGEAGADAYIVKSGFDQRDLLTTVAQLLGGAP